jgi:hypothetical protein
MNVFGGVAVSINFTHSVGFNVTKYSPGGTEPIGRRILEILADPFRTEIRDPHSGFIAYVPPGSIARGEALVEGPGAVVSACAKGLVQARTVAAAPRPAGPPRT